MGNSSLSINLLKKDQQSFLDKFIRWALTIGRFVVIMTEVIALSAFLYRFTLDRQLIDLHDSIKQKLAIVKLLEKNELTYRNLQDRIAVAVKLGETASNTPTLVTDILKFAPSDMILSTINYSGDRVRIEGRVQSVATLSSFIEKLRSYDAIKTVSLDQVENKTSTATIIVKITATLKKQPKEL